MKTVFEPGQGPIPAAGASRNEPGASRWTGCASYRSCLAVAVQNRWESWTCAACTRLERSAPPAYTGT